MKHIAASALVLLALLSPAEDRAGHRSYSGFDRNDYPGDAAMKSLRRDFSFTGYWLNDPPGSNANSWKGKRRTIDDLGFGFLVLFNGRSYAQIKAAGNAARLGTSDGQAAAAAARHEDFPKHTIIFLDQEEGGRLLREQRAYLHAWADAVRSAGFRTGVYCSGIAFQEDAHTTVITAEDIRQNAGGRELTYWVTNDWCPPSPGCTVPRQPLHAADSGVRFADVWQYAQSPRRKDFANGCPANYDRDGNCYPREKAERVYVDLDVATSPDPSHGRTR